MKIKLITNIPDFTGSDGEIHTDNHVGKVFDMPNGEELINQGIAIQFKELEDGVVPEFQRAGTLKTIVPDAQKELVDLWQKVNSDIIPLGINPPRNSDMWGFIELRGWVIETMLSEKYRAAQKRYKEKMDRDADYQTEKRIKTNRQKIQVNNQPFDVVLGLAFDALQEYNKETGTLFVRGGSLCRVIKDEDGVPTINEYTADSLLEILSLAAEFYKISGKKEKVDGVDGEEEKTKFVKTIVYPQKDIVRGLIARGFYPGIPALKGIVTTPYIRQDGTIFDIPGYDENTHLYYIPPKGFILPNIPETPTKADLESAADLLREVIIDFPFEKTKLMESSRDNVVGEICTLVLRPFIDGCIPLFLADKPQAGSGASLLTTAISLIATGRPPAVKTTPKTEEEWQKSLLSVLKCGTPMVVFDNVDTKLWSETLAAVLTAQRYGGRILGGNEDAEYDNNIVFVVNGNNISIGGDLIRRCYRSRMNPNMARPWMRDKFTHDPLGKWILQERGRIIAAVLTIARSWILAGKPAAPKKNLSKMGGFEDWQDTISGILHHAGFNAFLYDQEVLYDEVDQDNKQWESFIERLYENYKSQPFKVSDILTQVSRELSSVHPDGKLTKEFDAPELHTLSDVLPDMIADARKDKNRVLGRALSKKVDVVFSNGYTLKRDAIEHQAVTYIVKKVGDTNVGS